MQYKPFARAHDPLKQETWTRITQRLPLHTEGLRTEFIVHKSARNVYDHAMEVAGGRFVEVGTDEGATEEELDEAFDPERTAAYCITDVSSEERAQRHVITHEIDNLWFSSPFMLFLYLS